MSTSDFQTPENKIQDGNTVTIRNVWTNMYIACIVKGSSRTIARMKADEAVEDFMERFL